LCSDFYKKVYEIHGTIYKNHCTTCGKKYEAEYVFNSESIPKCSCGGIIKPDVVLYGEALPEREYNESLKIISEADMLIVAGTSLTVYPASGMVNLFNGKNLVVINRDKTGLDNRADLVINRNIKEVFEKLK
jgi:NAD-dependent deacetylase